MLIDLDLGSCLGLGLGLDLDLDLGLGLELRMIVFHTQCVSIIVTNKRSSKQPSLKEAPCMHHPNNGLRESPHA